MNLNFGWTNLKSPAFLFMGRDPVEPAKRAKYKSILREVT